MNRIDRITAILIQLQSKRIVKAREIAERFNISLRTVYRDIKTLEEAGVPIIGEAGTGYSIMEGYRLPPVQFTREEATAFLMAEKIIEQYTDSRNNDLFQSALFKIKSVLRTSEKDFLENIAPVILVLEQYNINGGSYLQSILNAIHEKRVSTMEYTDGIHQNTTHRDVEPIGIYLQYHCWYLIAYCRLRKDYRTFRVDRISHFKPSEDLFTTSHPTLKEYIKMKAEEKELKTVIISVDKAFAKYINRHKYYYGFVSETEKGEQIEMTFVCASLEDFARWYLLIAPHAGIIRPVSLKEQIRCRLEEIHKKL